jgi:hypothetical protein
MSERGGVQHSPRVDDAMAAETDDLTRGAPHESRAEDDHLIEPLDDEQGSVLAGLHDPAVDDEHVEVVARSELARFVRPSSLPADGATLRSVAREEGAPDGVLAQLAALPAGTRFATVAEIWEALGHETEHRAHVASPAESTPADFEPGSDHAYDTGIGRGAGAAVDREVEAEVDVDVDVDVDLDLSDGDDEDERDAGGDESWDDGPFIPALDERPEPSPGPVRAVAAGAFALTRGVLGVVDALLESVERRLRG